MITITITELGWTVSTGQRIEARKIYDAPHWAIGPIELARILRRLNHDVDIDVEPSVSPPDDIPF
jgi:hypothetical protein